MIAPEKLVGILNIIKIAENLKKELRHSWLSDGRHESVAEHSWRLSLMAMLLAPHLDRPVDIAKTIKLAIIHDLGEAKAGDIPVFEAVSEEAQMKKYEAEKQAMEEICAELPSEQGEELLVLWQEYEDTETYEAQFVKALDKLEVHLQHVEAPISTWSEIEYLMWFQSKWMKDHCDFDSTMDALADLILGEAIAKMEDAGEDLDSLRKAAA